MDPTADVTLENQYLKATISQSTNRLSQVLNKVSNQLLQVDQNFFWYNASAGTIKYTSHTKGNNANSSQASGAYIFRYYLFQHFIE